MKKLAVRQIISERRAREMFWTFVFDGDHSRWDKMRGASRDRVEAWFKENGEPLQTLLPKLRQWPTAVPFIENFIDGPWHLVSQGSGSLSAEIKVAGVGSTGKITNEGSLDIDYQTKFRSACSSRDDAISKCSLDALHTALSKGIASIDSYLHWRASIWNGTAGTPKLDDSKGKKVALEEKLRVWIPIMAGGNNLDLSGRAWSDFMLLQKVRDEEAIHSKILVQRTSPARLVDQINRFRSGIAGLLLELHRIIGEPAKRSIIRATYFPDVYLSS